MANSATGAAPALSGTRAPRRETSGVLLRLRTWVRRSQLDADIAKGRRRPGDPALALRESQLVEPRRRRQLATRLEEVVQAPKRPRRSGARAPVDRRAVEAASPVLADLADLLRSSDRVEPRGMALGWRLLTDPGSPIYEAEESGPSEGARLWRVSLDVLEELRPA
jgi:hypothetical protein